MTIYYEFHGGLHDGLVLANNHLHPMIFMPSDVQISTPQDYLDWMPKPGDMISVYVYKAPPRAAVLDSKGHKLFHHHCYLKATKPLEENPSWPR